MKTLKCLAWVVVVATNLLLAYLLWTWAAWPSGGFIVGLIGTAIIVDAVANMRRPKTVRFAV